MEAKINEFNDALTEVRKAHRLIYSYQSRMIDLAYFIKSKLDFPEFVGEKHFSKAIHKKRDGYLNVFKEMWAWDFIYSYLFEFYFGEKELDNNICSLSVVQYTDTGYFEKDDSSKTDINSFAPENESGSKLLFYLEVKPKGSERRSDEKRNIEKVIENKEYARIAPFEKTIPEKNGIIQVVCSYPLHRFLNEETTLKTLREFVNYCAKGNVVKLNII